MIGEKLKIYTLLSRLPYPRKYLTKILLAAFVGTHVPLLALLLFLVARSPVDFGSALYILGIVLLATIIGAVLTLYVLYALLAPVSLASRALRGYLDYNKVPDLPTNFDDRAGKLMADVQYTVGQLDEVIRSLEEQSSKDYLTGLYNRRACEERLAEDIARVERSEDALTLAVLDLDCFKPINDRYGHQAGDACLKHFADIIRRNTRESDWIARWGGDEFILVLRDAQGGSSADATLKRIVGDLDKNPVRLPQGDEIRLTFSGGVSLYTNGDDVRGSFARADRCLYQAKEDGRGKLVYHTDLRHR